MSASHEAADLARDLRAHLVEGRRLRQRGGSPAELAQWERHGRGIRRKWRSRFSDDFPLELTTRQIEAEIDRSARCPGSSETA